MHSNASSTHEHACYSGFYGTCSMCDAAGSCICGSFKTGHSDMLTMDRTRWGGIVYVCPIDLRVNYAIWALLVILNIFLGASCAYGLRIHIKIARKINQKVAGSRIVRFCGLMLISCVLNAALGVVKLVMPEQLIGISPGATFLFSAQQAFTAMAVATHTIHLMATALSTQESTLGRTRITEAVAREACRDYLLAAISAAFFSIPLWGSLVASLGDHSEALQQILLVVTDVGSICAYAANMTHQLRRTTSMLASYDSSIQALQASLIIASGGASISLARSVRAGASLDKAERKPAYIEAIEGEIAKLQTASRNVRWNTKMVAAGVSVATLSFVIFLIPHLWNRHSYSIAIINVFTKVAAYPMVRLYLPKRKRPDASNPAQRRNASDTNAQHVVQSI